MKPILVATLGLPQSGKSTWARQQPYVRVCPDEIRLSIHGQPYIQEAEPFVWATAVVMVRTLFRQGEPIVIFDATNLTKERRRLLFDPAWDTRFKVFETSIDLCLQRAMNTGRTDLVPVIQRMAENFEPLDEDCQAWEPVRHPSQVSLRRFDTQMTVAKEIVTLAERMLASGQEEAVKAANMLLDTTIVSIVNGAITFGSEVSEAETAWLQRVSEPFLPSGGTGIDFSQN